MSYIICHDCRTKHKAQFSADQKIFICPDCGNKIKNKLAKKSESVASDLKKGSETKDDVPDKTETLNVFSCFDCKYVWKRRSAAKVEMDFCPRCDLPTSVAGHDNDTFTRVQRDIDVENDY